MSADVCPGVEVLLLVGMVEWVVHWIMVAVCAADTRDDDVR